MGIFFNCGQVCSATSRLIVHRDIERELLQKLKARAESIRIGDPLDASTRLGALVNELQYNKVIQYIEVRGCCEPCSLNLESPWTPARARGPA